MRKLPAIIPLFFIAFIACSSHTEAPRKAAADLEGSAAVGMSYVDFEQKVQALGSAIALARREGASERALRPYLEALDIYKDGLELWKLKINCPADFSETGTECAIWITADTVGKMASKYDVPYEGSKLHEAWARKNINIPWYKHEAYPTWEIRQANRDVFPKLLSTIWDKAAQKSTESRK